MKWSKNILPFLKFNSQSGYSLVEAMMAMAISTIVGLESYSIVLNSQKLEKEINKKFAYTQLLAQIQLDLKDVDFINDVYADNTQLNNCRTRVGNCLKTGSAYRDIPFNIYNRRLGKNPFRVVGTVADPVFYDKDGILMQFTTPGFQPRFSLFAYAKPVCVGDCPANLSPESMTFIITVQEKDPKNVWITKRTFEVYQPLRSKQEANTVAVQCGLSVQAGQTVYKYSRGFNNGNLLCNWQELPSMRLDKKGDKGDQGRQGVKGRKGSTGKSACILDHVYGGVDYCGSASGAASYCANAQANENSYSH